MRRVYRWIVALFAMPPEPGLHLDITRQRQIREWEYQQAIPSRVLCVSGRHHPRTQRRAL